MIPERYAAYETTVTLGVVNFTTIRGDVAAIHAAVEAGQQKASELGTLIAAHVIPNPSPAVLKLLPAI